MLSEKIRPRSNYHNITLLMVQCVGKMIQVSNQLSQRSATEILNKPLFKSGSLV